LFELKAEETAVNEWVAIDRMHRRGTERDLIEKFTR
jgi:hypothetical protein